ncbi:tRNA lysidine(34) synthetase TilS [Streptococcus mutans]|uniref:tRNA lysidine(34) synthetase TilS n=1 Tax=Streptococcus mutans TaxID=1309 RepID=UPI0002B4DEE0|nr:tRNA lysidine(34) synthetase TilS [Streptococcus mutans]EMC44571.1 putative cell-cycle protein [Streptococcus mutans 24]EMC47428.1 putative cell-cycle protein [Streptococcus mutans SA38]EMP66589.1 tRNA(Ile)-lysidine synthetase [Streptococcus mutans KK23]MDP5885537.1 tRNA lysidine(34) synthetase TilS [Streptococcus mutans]MDW5546531.1 tRNA lysidine(34) synthetase TilS [Streptococcus mutans]
MTYEKVLKYVQEKKFFETHYNILIAVSGGVDSMNLLHFLHIYQKKLQIRIAVAHVNHKQRPQADEEEIYLKNWARDNHIPFYTAVFKGIFSEKKARDFRYTFFKNIMKEHGYTALVTAHHANDQAETVFLRLLRGSRLRYLTGIKEIQEFGNGQLIRPFLKFHKKELPNIFHFDDDSNQGDSYLRNRIRNHYLPILTQENPKLSQHLIQMSEETNLLFKAFSDLTSQLDIQDCQIFRSQSEAIQYFLLQNYLRKFPNLEVSKAQFDNLLHILRTKDYYYDYLKNNYYLKKDKKRFKICKIGPETDRFEGEKVLEYGSMVKYGQYIFSFQEGPDSRKGIAVKNDFPIIIRRRKPGDKIKLGSHSKKLRRLFIDEKIPIFKRSNAIIVEQDSDIILILLDGVTYLRKGFKDDIMKGRLYIQNRNW